MLFRRLRLPLATLRRWTWCRVERSWLGEPVELAGLLVSWPDVSFGVWESDRLVQLTPLGFGMVVRPVLSQSWSRRTRRVVLAIQPIVETPHGLEFEARTRIVVCNTVDQTISERHLPLGPFGLFGATWSADDGESWISCTTGEDLLLLDPADLSVRARLDSFYSGVETVPTPSLDGESDSVISSTGFTVRHGWAPKSRWLAAGNVGGLRLCDMEAGSPPKTM
jgi:hypothetical protein